jgi:metal-sulfur cluster biosynthetic enzyme
VDAAETKLWTALERVMDPELPVNVVDLGLIYGCAVQGGAAVIRMTFTTGACMCREWIEADVRREVEEAGFTDITIETVWHPPWTPARLSSRAREVLRELKLGA